MPRKTKSSNSSQNRKRIFPFSFHVQRKDNNKNYQPEIYEGFGLQHLSNTSSIYISTFNNTTNSAVCQPIGEAITLLKRIILAIKDNNPIAEYRESAQQDVTCLKVTIPNDFRTENVVDSNIARYELIKQYDTMQLAAYDDFGNYLEDEIATDNQIHYHPLYKLLPVFTLLLIQHKKLIPAFSNMIDQFAENPDIERFVHIHEEFYHSYKDSEYEIIYNDTSNYKTQQFIQQLEKKEIYIPTAPKKSRNNKAKNVIIKQYDTRLFNQNEIEHIPVIPKEIQLPDELRGYCNAIYDGASIATLFRGPSGTGKSMLCKLICQEINLPIMQVINCSENIDEYIFGKYIPQGDKIIFQENPITDAVRNGYAVIFEEINFAKPQYLAFMHSLLDDNGFIMLDNGTVVKRHPRFRLFATMNDGYFGTKELNQATLNRFNYIKEIDELSDEAIKRMLKARIPKAEKDVDQIIEVYKDIKAIAKAKDIDITISPRNLENWTKLAQYEGYEQAAKSTLYPVANLNKELEKSIHDIVNQSKLSAA